MHLKSLLTTLLFSILVTSAFTQKLQDNFRQSLYTYIFKLDAEQAKEIYYYRDLRDSNKYFSTKIDSYLYKETYDKSRLEKGHYLFINGSDVYARYWVYESPSLIIHTKGVNDIIYIYVYDLEGEIVKDARVRTLWEQDTAVYNEDCGCYPVPVERYNVSNTNLEVLIERGKDFTYRSIHYYFPYAKYKRKFLRFRYNKKLPKPPVAQAVKQTNTSGNTTILPGYLVLNQPKFKLLDTVKTKAFLLKSNGKPYHKKINYYIFNVSRGLTHAKIQLKPESRGAYTYEFSIPDSFLLDNTYRIELRSKKNRILKSENFSVENYDLKKVFFNAKMNQAYYFAGEPIEFNLSSYDANELPLLDAKVSILVKLKNVQDFFEDSLFVPFSWNHQFWQYESLTDPSGETSITLPDSLLPDARMNFEAHVVFSNTDGERKEFNLAFTYDPTQNRYLLFQENDSIHARYLFNSKPRYKKALIRAYHDALLYEESIELPYAFKVQEFPTRYELIVDDISRKTLDLNDSESSRISFEGYRNFDSINIQMHNPLGLEVNYKIYHGKEQIDGGSGSSLFYKRKYPSHESFHIIYSFRWKGVEYIKEKSFHVNEKKLNVEIDQPKLIYPGQKVPVHLKVKSYKNKGKKNVNLTAYAVNTQLGAIPVPQMPFFGTYKTGILETFSAQPNVVNINKNKNIRYDMVNALSLYQSPFYRLTLAKNGLGKVYEEIDSAHAEFSPYIIRFNANQKIFAIYLDNEPIYFENTNLKVPYSFRAKPGTYDIKVRTIDKMITFKNIELKKGKKLFICFREEYIGKNKEVTYVKLNAPYLDEEKQNLNQHMMFYQMKTSFNFLQQNTRIFNMQSYQNHISRTGNGQFYNIGPLKKGDITLINTYSKDSLTFYFDPSMAYIIWRDSISTYPLKDTRIQYTKHPERTTMNVPMVLNERAPQMQTVLQKNQSITSTTKPQKTEVKQLHPALHNYIKNYSIASYSNLQFKVNGSKNIQKLWLFNYEDEKWSRIYFGYTPSIYYLKPGKYDMFFIASDNTYCRYNGYELRPDGINYRIIEANEFRSSDPKLFEEKEDLIVRINMPPLRTFNTPPQIIDQFESKPRIQSNNQTMFSGYIMDKNGNPFDRVVIFLEINGVFKSGALTNQLGYFEIQNIEPGNYQFKIYRNGKFYNLYDLQASFQKNTVVKVYLPDGSGMEYRYEYRENTAEPSYTVQENAVSPSVSYYSDGINRTELAEVAVSSGKRSFINRFPSMGGQSDLIRSISNSFSKQNTAHKLLDSEVSTEDMNSMMERLKQDKNANKIRSNFRDYAYFIPNLITDRKGEAHFTITFPDNQTSWKTIVPAIDYKKNTGIATLVTKAYKPVSASLALPRFYVENDSLLILGKILNYTDDKIVLTSSFKLNETIKKANTSQIEKIHIDSHYLWIGQTGNFHVTYAFETNDHYIDGEKRELPVYLNGIETVQGNHFIATGDSQITLWPSDSINKRKVVVTNKRLDFVLEIVNRLKNYGYGCNEQNASKLKALMAEKSIMKSLGKDFENNKLIVKLIKDLEKNQRKVGSWGWWNPGNPVETWMTVYITEALNMAAKEGYHTRAHYKGASYLKSNFSRFNVSDKLYALQLLSEFYEDIPYQDYINKYDTFQLSLQDRFRMIRLKQMHGFKYNIMPVMISMTKTDKGVYWGENILNFKVNILVTSSIAYEILKNDSISHNSILKQSREYFLTHRDKARNTIEQATIIKTVVDDLIANNSIEKELTSSLKIEGSNIKIKKFPFEQEIPADQLTRFTKSGSPLYFSVYEYQYQRKPASVDSIYKIKSWLSSNGKNVEALEKGTQSELNVQIMARKHTEYVMIEIPIPSSCIYGNKASGSLPYEIHRQYYDDKVAIFCKGLPKGRYNISINLVPRFTGKASLLPVQASLMYFPDRTGRNEIKEVWVK